MVTASSAKRSSRNPFTTALVSTTTLVTEWETDGADGAAGSTDTSGASVLMASSQPIS